MACTHDWKSNKAKKTYEWDVRNVYIYIYQIPMVQKKSFVARLYLGANEKQHVLRIFKLAKQHLNVLHLII